MSAIATYVFLDMETSDLPRGKSKEISITELNMVAMKRRHLQSKIGQLPRVLHKLTMCFKAEQEIVEISAKMSGLNNDILSDETTFNKDIFGIINTFLKSQEKPVCFIAHNGFRFEFPILQAQFEKLGVYLPDDILCVDSLYGFNDVLKRQEQQQPCSMIPTLPKPSFLFKNKTTDISEDTKGDKKMNNSGDNEEDKNLEIGELSIKRRRLFNESMITAAKKLSDALRESYYDPDPYVRSHKLPDIYKRELGDPMAGFEYNGNRNHTVMDAKIAIKLGEEFLQWVDENTVAFSEKFEMPENYN